MLKIGITGGIGSGKTVVCRLFAVLGVPVYDADTRAKWVMRHDPVLRHELIAAFGPEAYLPSGEQDRLYLARRVFNDPAQLERLNGIVHPRVGQDFADWAAAQQQAGHAYVLKEAALLYESGSYKQLDRIITVFAPQALRQQRVLRRDPHRTPDDVLSIIGKQLSEEEKRQRADFVLYNDDQQMLLPQVLALHEKIQALAGAATV
ncbi:dephospho-CoA kinase [Hymenobacter busanensis]|uniref:Dephospho-CoA kinase n=1 Tax=Hymenobacter busanensis TaxID=2607656 RepID=A0A7L4ZY73_9BACT|nr:dephospho-CoA kinase [Hymenobacter busanensis]KAA9331293.1 dephospho-CoA kinase [Hymenobacter busanensis]QHJ08444.1 dephospho-CoA kinase [Hymenobacter busanensis]